MALPEFSMRQLLEAGAHFGHQTHRWNPKMERYIFGSRSNIHIIDLSQTMPAAAPGPGEGARSRRRRGGRVLFVGTKRQASEPVATAAKRCAQYYVNHRWLGGTLTNWRTISGSIARLRELEGVLDGDGEGRTKKELLQLTRERDKLELSPGRHQGHGRHPRPDVRDRHQQGSDRDPGSAQAEHPGGGDPRHQLRSGRHHLPDPGQRRRGPRAAALLRPDRRRGAGRPGRRPGRPRASTSAPSEAPVEPALRALDRQGRRADAGARSPSRGRAGRRRSELAAGSRSPIPPPRRRTRPSLRASPREG